MPGKRVIYLNLLIDRIWAKASLDRIFPVRSPANMHFAKMLDQLGFFFGSEGDSILLNSPLDKGLASYLEIEQGLPISKMQQEFISHDPIGSGWTASLEQSLPVLVGREVLWAGTSKAEAVLWERATGTMPEISEDAYVRWNDKRYLMRLAKSLELPFPETHEVRFDGRSLPLDDGPWIFKAAHSAGGSGLVDGGDDWRGSAQFLQRMMESAGVEMPWLAQRKISRAVDFYTLGEISESGEPNVSSIFLLEYEKNNTSMAHHWVSHGPQWETLSAAAKTIGKELAREGYRGSFGIDSFQAASGEVFPAIDLNVRLDKCRCIEQVMKRFGFKAGEASAYRKRILGWSKGFAALWERCCSQLNLGRKGNGPGEKFLFPFAFAEAYDQAEIYWLSGIRGKAPASKDAASWATQIVSELECLSTERRVE